MSVTLSLKRKPKKTLTCKPHSLSLSHPVANSSSFFQEQSALNNLEVEVAYNPLHLKSNLYKYLKSSLYKPPHRQQPQPREQRPERHQPRQVSPCVCEQPGRGLMFPPGHIPAECALLVKFLQEGCWQLPVPSRAGCSTSKARHSQHLLPQGAFVFVSVLQPQSRAKAAVAPLLMAPSPLQMFRPAAAARRGSCEGSLLPKEYEEFLQ